jgi:hypothetical protein
MSSYFVCLDTSILRDVFDEIRSRGSEPKGWTELKKLIDAKEAKLLVPEIVLLEFEKGVREASDDLHSEMLTVEASIKRDDLKEAIGQRVKQWRSDAEHDLRQDAKKIIDWLKTSETIEYTQEIVHSTQKRVIARKFYVIVDPTLPRSERDKLKSQEAQWLRDQDCAIVESLISFFGGKLDGQLAFAATDYKGFGPIRKDTGVGSLDHTFRDGLPPTQLFDDLEKLVDFVKSKGTVNSLTPEEEEEIQREQAEAEQTRRDAAAFDTFIRQEAEKRVMELEVERNQLPLFQWAQEERNRRVHGQQRRAIDDDRRRRVGRTIFGPYAPPAQPEPPKKDEGGDPPHGSGPPPVVP